MVTEDTSSAAAFDPLKTIETYIDGKMRRYTLLFAVNGGAFAIAQLFKDQGNSPFLVQLESFVLEGILSRRRRRGGEEQGPHCLALVNPCYLPQARGMKSLLYHAFGVKGFRYLRRRYEGGETYFELEPEKEPEVPAGQKLRRHGYRWRTVRSVSIGLKPVVLKVGPPLVKHHDGRRIRAGPPFVKATGKSRVRSRD